MNIEIKRVKLSEIKLNPDNPRTISNDDMDRLVKSLQEFPEMMDLREIVVDDTMTCIGGNMRTLALRKVKAKECTAKIVTGLTQEQKREFVIKDNSNFGEYDVDILANSWDDLPLADWGLDLPEDWMDVGGAAGLTDPDDVPEVPKEATTKPGDIWLMGKHKVMCGDSTKAEEAERLMAGKKAALIHADPPYGMGKEKDGVQNDNLYREKLDAFQMAWWQVFRPFIEDNGSAYIWGNSEDLTRLWWLGGLKDSERLTWRNLITWDKYDKSTCKPTVIEMMRSYCNYREDCLFFMLGEQGFNNNADNYWEGFEPIRSYLDGEREKAGWNNKIVAGFFGFHPRMADHWFSKSQWSFPTKEQYGRLQAEAKHDAFKREHDAFKREHDELKREHDELKREFYSTRAYFDNTHDNMTDVWSFPRVTGEERHGHATPKPVDMIARAIKSSLSDGGICAEPFLGSGSTLIACEKTGRTCYGMEIDPLYCDVIVKRWEDYSGEKATLEL